MRVTVLGKSPSWQDAGGACSGYLIEDGASAVLLDCGNGVFAKLRKFRDYCAVDAVVISHMHADHFLDLVPYSYALTYAPRQQPVPVDRWPGTDTPARPKLYAPSGAEKTLRRVAGGWGSETLVLDAFDLTEYAAEDSIAVGSLEFHFQEVPHFARTYAVAATATTGPGRLVYGADCRPSNSLVEFASSADLLIIEATLPRPERSGERGHLTPEEAGEHAQRAGSKRLVLTHISDELDGLDATKRAAEHFDGPVEIARESAVYEV